MSPSYFEEVINLDKTDANISWSFITVINTFDKIDETMNKIFTKKYLHNLDIVNYKIFNHKTQKTKNKQQKLIN